MKSRKPRHARREDRRGPIAASPSPSPLRGIEAGETAAYLALFGLVALVFSPQLQVQFTLPKLLVVRTLVPVVAACWLLRLARNDVQPLRWPVTVPAALLAVWWAVTTIVSVHPPTAMNGAHGRYNGLWNQLLFLLLFLLAASSRFEASQIRRLVTGLVVALIPVSLYALLQYGGWDPIRWPGERSASTIGNPVILSATIGLAVPFALTFALLARHAAERWWWSVCLLILLGASFTTLSRGPLVASVLAGFVVVAAVAWERRRRLSPVAVIVALIATVPMFYVGYRQLIQVRESISGAAPAETSRTLRDRLNTYAAAVQIIRDRPLFGVGLENFSVVYPRYRSAESERLTPDVLPTMVHSGYLQAAATTGVPGLFLYCVLMLSVLVGLATAYAKADDKRTRWLIVAFIASIAGYLIQDLSGWLEISLSTFFWIILGLGVALSRAGAERRTLHQWFRPVAYAGVALSAAGSVWLATQTVTIIRADYLARRALLMRSTESWDATRATVMRALEHSRDAAYLDNAGLRFAERFGSTGDLDAHQMSVRLFQEAHQGDPFQPYYLIHWLAVDTAALQRKTTADLAASEQLIPRLLKMDPNNAAVHEAIARRRLAEGRVADALISLDRAKALRPRQARFLILEGDARRAMNQRSASIGAYEQAVALLPADDSEWRVTSQKLVLTLIEEGLSDRSIAKATELTVRFPADATAHTLLGFAYLQKRQFAFAEKAFADALRLNPDDPNARQGLAEAKANAKL